MSRLCPFDEDITWQLTSCVPCDCVTCVSDVHVDCMQASLDQQHAPDSTAGLLLDQCD